MLEPPSSNMTSIEEIVKYQQELINYQRNQKQIQKETIKLLNSLNYSLTLMSERLDEFAMKNSIKLEDYSPSQTNNNLISTGVTSLTPRSTSNNLFGTQNQLNTTSLMTNNVGNHNFKYLIDNNEIIYLSGDITTTTTPPPSQTLSLPPPPQLQNQQQSSNKAQNSSTASCSINNHNHQQQQQQQPSNNNKINKNDMFILNDLSSSLINIDQLTSTSNQASNKIYLINNNNMNHSSTVSGHLNGQTTVNILNNGNNNNSSNGNHTNTISSELLKSPSKLLDTSNSKEEPHLKLRDTEEGNSQQRLFNKFVREAVEKRLGKEFLLMHEIQEINQDIMEDIRKEALEQYPPINIRPRRAWHLAKASLRCRRRSLRRQNEKQHVTSTTTTSMSTSQTSESTSAASSPSCPQTSSSSNITINKTSAQSNNNNNNNSSHQASSNNENSEKNADNNTRLETSLMDSAHLTGLSSI